ncbi:hypothetical protein TNCV_1897941 [Trichonephila clavipes]|uniref:Uncharacterized protein n=1 Tax=Trichonephila clavipes TaxID=2585209 RepID=A0A8X6WEY3_TRICX|nr:hypothetical protein TNCV_1897941 [Trichonephila clavipes]
MPLSSSMSTAKPIKKSFTLPTVCSKQSSTRTFSFISPVLQEELISCLTRVAISEKARRPQCVESLWLPSQAKLSAISSP